MIHFRKHTGRKTTFLIPFILSLLLLALVASIGLAQEDGGWPAPTYDDTSAAAARDQLDEILSRPEYQWSNGAEPTGPSLWDRIINQLLDFLFELLPENRAAANVISYVLAAVGIILIALVLALVLRSFLRNFAANPATAEDVEEEETISASAAQQQADHFSSSGDYRTAVRFLYLSALLSLDEHGLLRYDRSRTNREYLKSVSHRPVLADTLRLVVDVFDAVWYGYKPLDADTYTAYAQQVEYLRGLV